MDSISNIDQLISYIRKLSEEAVERLLAAVIEILKIEDVVFENVCELDETFVLECCKGKELPGSVDRKPRKHGAKAPKRGNEYVCINTGVQRDGGAAAGAVNRAKPDNSELEQVYTGHIGKDSLLLCDGLHGYASLAVLGGRTAFHDECGLQCARCFYLRLTKTQPF